MIFHGSLGRVENELQEAHSAVRSAIGELESLSGLRWRSAAGQAFAQRARALSADLERLARSLAEARAQLPPAAAEIRRLEAALLAQKIAG